RRRGGLLGGLLLQIVVQLLRRQLVFLEEFLELLHVHVFEAEFAGALLVVLVRIRRDHSFITLLAAERRADLALAGAGLGGVHLGILGIALLAVVAFRLAHGRLVGIAGHRLGLLIRLPRVLVRRRLLVTHAATAARTILSLALALALTLTLTFLRLPLRLASLGALAAGLLALLGVARLGGVLARLLWLSRGVLLVVHVF